MESAAFRIDVSETAEDRFSRFRLLRWWDQEKVRSARVAVIGAGALGNEILKNLALLGFERILIVDSDRIELSNLSRSVLYRESDIGRSKAETAASAYLAIYDRATVVGLAANIHSEVGAGLFAWADIVIAGLDNRESRLWINRWAWHLGVAWVDGAIEGLSGVARVFLPGSAPCYECTLGAIDWQILNQRMSCNLLTRREMEAGKVPTTPTTASVIAGIEVQEALKFLHGLPLLQSKGFVFDGTGHTSYVVEYTENPECLAHHVFERVLTLPETSSQLTLNSLYERAQWELGANNPVVEFSRDVIHKLVCSKCGAEEEIFRAVGTVSLEKAECPGDGSARNVVAIHSYTGAESYGHRRLSELGTPLWDVFVARSGESEVAFLIGGDAPAILGRLHPSEGLAQ